MDFYCHTDSPGSFEDRISSARDAEQRIMEAGDLAQEARAEARKSFQPPDPCPWCGDRDWDFVDGDRAGFTCLGCDARSPTVDPTLLTEDAETDPAAVWESVKPV